MTSSGRIGRAGLAASIAALAVLAISSTASASTSRAGTAARPRLGPPLGRAKPARSVPRVPGTPTTSPWHPFKNHPPFIPGTMLLASNGTVLVHSEPPAGGTPDWWKLTPDSHGNYTGGTWTKIASMPNGYDPLYFGSAILPDGRMLVEGGEYLGGNATWTNKGAIYDPVHDTWRMVAPPPGWTNIGDVSSEVLANGTFMMDQDCQNCTSSNFTLTTGDALFNATGNSWDTLSGQGKNDPNDEEGWTLLPNGQILTVDTWLTPTTETFSPQTLRWNFAGNTPTSPVNGPNVEIGPQVEMPGGNVFVAGGGSGPSAPAPCNVKTPAATAVYHYGAGTWSAGPRIPTINGEQYDSADGPGTVLPDGKVLFDVSPCVFNAPLAFDVYDPSTNSISPAPNIANAANDSTYYTRMLVLPNGQILFNDGSTHMETYSDGGAPNPGWAPNITGLSSTALTPGTDYSVSGTQFAGLDQGAAYGDDVQSNTNFPLVRITNSASHVVTYARTWSWSSVSVAPGAFSSTEFALPASTPAGASTLQVVANGIASAPVGVTVS